MYTFTLKTIPVFKITKFYAKTTDFRRNGSFFNFVPQFAKIAYGPNLAPCKRILRFDDRNYGAFNEPS